MTKILIVCTSCKTSCNDLSHFDWGLGQFVWGGGGRLPLKFWGVVKKRESPDFRSPEVGISATLEYKLGLSAGIIITKGDSACRVENRVLLGALSFGGIVICFFCCT